MRPVKILTDSCSDLPLDLREKYNIDYLKMNTVRDGRQTPASLDWEYFTPHELYDTIRGGNRVTTTQVPEATFEHDFRAVLEQGYDIVYVACAGKMSGSVFTGIHVAEKLEKEYDGAKIYCVDSLNACMGEGMLAIRAAQLRDEGKSAKDIYSEVNAVRNNVNQFVTVHNLNALRAAGRVTGSSAFFGNLLGVKPIIVSDKTGNNIPIKKVKGRANSIEEIVNLTAEAIENPEEQTIYVFHSDCAADADEAARLLKEKINCKDVYTGFIGPIIGASIGADAIAIFSFGKNVERFSQQ
ncbi:MAG TPA: hypothetical protein DEO32_01610 [Ruminococcaceae bacterium]|nr:hypothetical protein [Oscillospiraceae bacterium]